MSTSAQPAKEQVQTPEPEKSLSGLAPLGALSIAVCYAIGYVIVAVQHGRYGLAVADVTFLKPRMFSAGLLFVVFVAVPLLLAFRTFRFFGFGRKAGFEVPSGGHQPELRLLLSVQLYWMAWGLASGVLKLFSKPIKSTPVMPTPSDGLLATSLYMTFGIIMLLKVLEVHLISKHFPSAPRRCIALVFVNTLAFVIYTFRVSDPLFMQLSLWFYGIMLFAAIFGPALTQRSVFKSVEWEWFALALAPVLLVWFSRSIYSNVKPEYGGGAPVSVTISLQQTTPQAPRGISSGLLLDENEHGFPRSERYRYEGRVHSAQSSDRNIVPAE